MVNGNEEKEKKKKKRELERSHIKNGDWIANTGQTM